MEEARFFDQTTRRCLLCPHHCDLSPGKTGLCRVRCGETVEGRDVAVTPFRGRISSLAMDPIEKKPLYHWHPGSFLLSAGFLGCNLHCPFCQNFTISQTTDCPTRLFSPRALVAEAVRLESFAIAYTYSEPLVHIEYLLECMQEAHEAGVLNVLVSNGCIELEPAREVLSLTDACNIDLKTSAADDYRRVLGGEIEAVQAFITEAVRMGVHTEVTTLVVTGFNDSLETILPCAEFLSHLSPDIPWHLSAYHPAFRWDKPPTSPDILYAAQKAASPLLNYIHLGNIR